VPVSAVALEERHVSEKNASAPASANGKPAAKEAVIRRLEAAEETAQERLIKKHVPAWVVSGAVHVAVIALAILIFPSRGAASKPTDKVLVTTAEKQDEPDDKNLTNEDPGLDSKIEAALPDIERLDQATVDSAVTNDNIGQPDAPSTDTTALAPPGLDTSSFTTPGLEGDKGLMMQGDGGKNGAVLATFPGRSGATKSRLVREGGGNDASERAVALGLAWLAKQQKQDGGWEYDQGSKEERVAATGMALLPFLAAGCTHKPSKERGDENKYTKNVGAGLGFLMKMCPPSGPNAGRLSANMYAQGIGTMALVEAYGMTKDPVLKPYAQAAINFVQRSQGPNGSWGYAAGGNGDTSIVGWQVQALQAAKLSRDLVVDDRVIKKAISFLNHAAGGSRKSMYGYGDSAGAAPGTALTSVGLLCRYYLDGWGPSHPGMIDGVAGLVKNPPAGTGGVRNMYYYYYATQVVHFYEGEDWKNWNEGPKQADGTRKNGMRDWLVSTQIKKDDDAKIGSWDPEAGWFGSSCGRLGTTAMCLLTLEVYYRHLPLYKRGADAGGVKVIEDVK
jgi:hypothetical protein